MTVSTREGADLFNFETKNGDIEEINTYINNLTTEPTIESGTYYAKFSAITYMDTTVNTFLFSLFKGVKKN